MTSDECGTTLNSVSSDSSFDEIESTTIYNNPCYGLLVSYKPLAFLLLVTPLEHGQRGS